MYDFNKLHRLEGSQLEARQASTGLKESPEHPLLFIKLSNAYIFPSRFSTLFPFEGRLELF